MMYYKRIKIAQNDDLEYFQRKVWESTRIPNTFHNDVGYLPGTTAEKCRDRFMTEYEIQVITNKMGNKNFKIMTTLHVGLTLTEKYIEFYDEVTYAEFMLLS